MLKIVDVIKEEDISLVRELFEEYAASLSIDLSFQDFRNEMENLPGKYCEPFGCMMLAKLNGKASGCIALAKIDDKSCEMKRLYVRSEYRGQGIGKLLVQSVLDKAREIGYHSMKLDTIASMKEAIGLYESMGFTEIDAYRYNPSKSAVYMELVLE